MNPQIMTVRGPIPPEELGFTSMHEHVLVNSETLMDVYADVQVPMEVFPFPGIDDPLRIEDLAYLRHGGFVKHRDTLNLDEGLMTEEVADYSAAGGRGLLECTVPGLVRDVSGCQRISEATGVHIIVSTGLYAEETWPNRFRDMDHEDFVAYLRDEIDAGLDGTGIKPGQIKTASNGSTERELAFFKAAAEVAAERRLMVTLHTEYTLSDDGCRAAYQTFLDSRLPPEKLLMAHFQGRIQELRLPILLRDPDAFRLKLDFAREVLGKGINISFDCFGNTYDAEPLGLALDIDTYKLSAIYQLVDEGYQDQIVIGTDVFLKIMTRRCGGHGYVRLQSYVVPMLRMLGVSDAAIRAITVENPARILAL